MNEPLLLIDGWDIASAGVVLDNDGSGWRDAPELSYQTATWPGRREALLLGTEPVASARRLVITGLQKAATMEELRELRDQVKRHLGAGRALEIAFGDAGPAMDRVYFGYLERVAFEPIKPAYRQPAQKVRITLLCPDPREHDRAETIVDCTAPAELPVATAPSYPIIRVTGPVVDPVITLLDADGEERQRMAFLVTLEAGEVLVVDCQDLRITAEDGTARPETLLEAADFITLDPRDSAGPGGPHATVAITPAPAHAEARYRLAWD